MNEAKKPIFEPPPVIADGSWNIPDKEFQKFRRMIYEYSGINLTEEKRELLRARVGKLMRRRKIKNFEDYCQMVDDDKSGQEIVELIDAISTNVTFFFREEAHFQFLTKHVLPELTASARKRIRFWSAACSTGEEPYSIAITAMPFLGGSGAHDFKLLASDISTKVLAHAKAGRYDKSKVKGLPPQAIQQYFNRNGSELTVRPELRNLITFARVNLQSDYPFKGPFDVIFCRNVMIYFDRQTQERLVGRFYEYLRPGGYLFIGHSENLSMINHSFKNVQPAVYCRA